jgi:hypothetical protein
MKTRQELKSGIKYLNQVKGIETWVKAEKKDAELQNMIAEQKLRTQRILGNLIKEGQLKGEIATQKDGRPVCVSNGDTYKTLDEIQRTILYGRIYRNYKLPTGNPNFLLGQNVSIVNQQKMAEEL